MSGTKRVERSGLQVAAELDALISDRAAPGTGVDPEAFWAGFAGILADLTPRNRELLARRDDIQAQIDAWHVERKGKAIDPAEYRSFLEDIGYLLPEPEDFTIAMTDVDDEIADEIIKRHQISFL